MSRGQNPLIWMMAISLPSAGHALGLGDIHVDSALNEPLIAEIDIVGASPEELSGVVATVANRETFLRFGAERQNFLQSTTFKVSQDAHGRPVLALRSTESFSEPLVDLVVDLRWRNGELIRQYSLLLDPAGFPSANRAAQPLATPASQAAVQAPVVSVSRPEAAARNAPVIPTTVMHPQPAVDQPLSSLGATDRKSVRVGAKATLRGIAWRVGARSRPDINRLMFAIYRANPAAFDGNINRLHLGAVLTIPAADEVASIPQSDANREIRSQMSSWLSTWKGSTLANSAGTASAPAAAPATAAPPAGVAPAPVVQAAPVPVPATTPAVVARSPAPAAAPAVVAPAAASSSGSSSVDDMNNAELAARIQQLENSLREVQSQLDAEHGKMLNMQSQARFAEQQHAAAPKVAPVVSTPDRSYLGMLIGGVAVLLGALGALILRSRRNVPPQPALSREPISAPLPVPMPAPVMAQKHTYSPAKPLMEVAPAPVVVQETRAVDDSLLELSQLEPSADLQMDMSSQLGIDHHADASLADTTEVDTRGVTAARSRDDDAATRMRQELEAAWSIPSAEDYQRFDDTEATLAEAIEKSMAETSRLRVTQVRPDDLIDNAETNRNLSLDNTSTVVGAGETVLMDADTNRLPAATLAMHADEIARAFEDPTVQQPRPDPNQLDYNLLDLDQLAFPAVDSLHEHVVVKDQRASPIETLKKDLQRQPERDDLRLQALETYVAQAAIGREYAQVIDELTEVRELLTEAEWNRANELVQHSAGRPDSADHLLGDDDLLSLDRLRA